MTNLYKRVLTAVGSVALLGGALSFGAQAQNRAAAPYFRDDAAAGRSALSSALYHSRALTLDVAGMQAALATAPAETQPGAQPLILALPLPDGSTSRFAVTETALMAPALAAQFPQIKTYRGVGLDDPTATVRLDLTPQGFHAQILSHASGTVYIDPATRGDRQHVLSFYRRDMNRAAAGAVPSCQLQPSPAEVAARQQRHAAAGTAQRTLIATGPTRRTYRLAVSATGEYTAFQGGTVALAQAAIVTSVNRVVGVYEKEVAVRLVLVATNNLIVYTNSGTDPYTNGDPDAMIDQAQTNIDAVIGSANYDIGHVFGTNSGGLAGLGVVCVAGNKARGVTGSGSPSGDAFDIDYVAHEMGHQFDADHTFNSPSNSCGGNGNSTTAYEPGSGSTIMAYAGICSPDNLQNNSDAYFHSGSFQQIATFVASTGCGASTATGNSAPTVTAPANRVLPIGTPFRLTATATDPDGDALTYCWEQMNAGPFATLTAAQAANSNVPLFRSFTPVASPTRTFPRLSNIISNTSTTDERLPTVTRTLLFRCTARDQHSGPAGVIGGVNYSSNVSLSVTSAAGPFLVTAPNTALTWAGNSTQTVTWSVAGTTANGVNCATVNVLLSTDGGLTYPTTLASGVANDGSQAVTVPNISTSTARIMVEAVGNYFFDISNANFTITAAAVTAAPVVTTPANGSQTNDNTPVYTGTAPANSSVTVLVDGSSTGTTMTDAAGNWTLTPVVPLADGPHTVQATAQLSGQTVSPGSNTNTFTVDTTPPPAPVVTTPANGSQTNDNTPAYAGTAQSGTTVAVLVDGSPVGTTTATGAGSWSFTQPTALADGSHTVRARATDGAGNPSVDSNTNTFSVDATAPTATISSTVGASGSSTGTAPIPFTVTFSESVSNFVVGDVTVTGGTVTTGSFTPVSGTVYTFSVTPAASGTVTVNVAASVAQDAATNGNTAATAFSIIYNQATTAAPVVTAPANGSTTANATPTYSGTAPAGSTVAVNVDGTFIGTTTATGGNWSFNQPTALSQGSHTVYATAQSSGQTVSPNSNANTFTVDTTAPTVTSLSSSTGASGSSTTTTPFAFAVSFSESVTGFAAGGITVTNGTVTGGPSGSGSGPYTFTVTPTTAGTATTVTIAASAAQDAAGNGNAASATYSLTLSAPATATSWTGAISTDWYAVGNWSDGVPTASLDVIIPAGRPHQPLIGPGAAIARGLTINSGATLSQTDGTLDVRANLINNGNFTPTGGTVVLGTTFQSNGPNILGSSRVRFWNLTINANGVLLSTSAGASARRLVTLNGALVTQSNPFVLESDANGTALVVNNSGGFVLGSATVQRYISPAGNAGPGYRHVSAPVGSATVSSLTTAGFTPTVNAAYNSSATPNLVTPFPTVFGYDQSRLASVTNNLSAFDKGWASPASAGDALTAGKGYTVNLAAGQALSFTGPLNNDVQTQTLARLAAGATNADDAGWHLVGNPYPAPLDYSQVAAADRTGLDGAIYVYQSTGPYVGQYRTYLAPANVGNPILPLGQGFFVRVSTGSPSGTLTFRNTQRVTTYQNPAYQRTTTETRPFVQLTLKPAGSGSPLTDDLYVYFEQGATDGFDSQYDAAKLSNPSGLNLSTVLSATQRLAIDGRAPLTTVQRVVPLAVGVPAVGSYTLDVAQLLNLAAVPTYLRDLQTGALVDLAQQRSYQFTVSNATALITGRFELVFSPQRPTATATAAALQLSVWPNPVAGQTQLNLTLSKSVTAATVTLRDVVGRTVATRSFSGPGTSLPTAGLATGTYLLSVTAPGQTPVTRRVVVE
jgi:Metallo-peptidase family M12B Reprolysin-like/Bacterial Ig-like domain